MQHLYHGTILRHVPSITREGLLPSVGTFTRKVHGNGEGVVPAVFMADETGLERVVHAMVAAVMDELTDADFDRYDVGNDYRLNDALFFEHGALFLIEPSEVFRQAGEDVREGEPQQCETGDWYSLCPVAPVRLLAGGELETFLSERGLVPSAINDFVDPESVPLTDQRPR